MESLQGFTSLISSTLCPASSFDLLPPPSTVGFLKLSRPCCYVFPAGCGDCAFFAINGFTVLVDGGSDSQACFWKLVRHLDRVDAVLLTHTGTENLPGVISFLQRKVGEKELTSELKGRRFLFFKTIPIRVLLILFIRSKIFFIQNHSSHTRHLIM